MSPIDKILKKYISNYLILINFILFFQTVFAYILGLYNLTFLIIICSVIHIILIVVLHPLQFQQIKFYIPIYTLSFSIWLYMIVASEWIYMSVVLVWYCLIPISLKNIYINNKSIVIKTCFLSLFLVVLTLVTPNEFSLNLLPDKISETHIFWMNINNIIITIFLFFFLFFIIIRSQRQ